MKPFWIANMDDLPWESQPWPAYHRSNQNQCHTETATWKQGYTQACISSSKPVHISLVDPWLLFWSRKVTVTGKTTSVKADKSGALGYWGTGVLENWGTEALEIRFWGNMSSILSNFGPGQLAVITLPSPNATAEKLARKLMCRGPECRSVSPKPSGGVPNYTALGLRWLTEG